MFHRRGFLAADPLQRVHGGCARRADVRAGDDARAAARQHKAHERRRELVRAELEAVAVGPVRGCRVRLEDGGDLVRHASFRARRALRGALGVVVVAGGVLGQLGRGGVRGGVFARGSRVLLRRFRLGVRCVVVLPQRDGLHHEPQLCPLLRGHRPVSLDVVAPEPALEGVDRERADAAIAYGDEIRHGTRTLAACPEDETRRSLRFARPL